MLNALFGSEARVKVLNLFLLHPENKYQLSQIARDLELPVASVRKEVEGLTALGLVESASAPELVEEEDLVSEEKPQNQKAKIKKEKIKKPAPVHFIVNRRFILFPEIKTLFIKAQVLSSQKFISSLEKNFQPKLLILTGFFTNSPEAQTDLLIVGHVKRPAFLKLIAELEKDLGHEINYTIFDEKEFRYRQEIMDIFLYNILEGKTITLINSLTDK